MRCFQDTMVWETPEIPPKPAYVEGIEQAGINLNSNSDWKFLFQEIKDIPLPTDENQDYSFDDTLDSSWGNVIVPGELSMQGFPIKNNKEYYYRRGVSLSESTGKSRVLLRFDGVYSKARVWINGRYVRKHTGGFTTWDCDITEYIKNQVSFTLVVGIADIEGQDIGLYNPTGEKMMSDPSRASHYAHHAIGGILRDVSLVILPEIYIASMHTNTQIKNDWTRGILHLKVRVRFSTDQTTLRYTLLDENSVVATGGMPLSKADLAQADCEIQIDNPKLWDAEHPHRYTLCYELYEGDRCLQENHLKIGFREIWYGGAEGSDSNKVYVNGNEVKLRGVCRHDMSFDRGRSTTGKEDYTEIRAYREHNINHVRTSHYPPSQSFLDACDELGMYVEEETAVCFQSPFGQLIYTHESEFMNQFTEMVERDRNHPSIIIWSLGNESNFELNSAFRKEYNYIKETDTSRPVKYSFPFTIASLPMPYDIISAHYKSVETELGHPLMPVLHDEFAHIACYNIGELQNDPNVRNFWGESIKMAWESVFTTDGALGADLWGAIDEIFYPNITLERLQPPKGLGQVLGYGAWGSVLDVYRRLKPEAYLTKKAYSPIRIDEKSAKVSDGTLRVVIKNWHDHTWLSELIFTCVQEDNPKAIDVVVPNLSPHEEGLLEIKGISSSWQKLQLIVTNHLGHVIDDFVFESEKYKRFRPMAGGSVKAAETDTSLTIETKSASFLFDKKKALLSGVIRQGEKLDISGPYFHMENGVPIHTWKPVDKGMEWVIQNNIATVLLHGTYGDGEEIIFYLKIFGDGTLVSEYQTRSTGEFNEEEGGHKSYELGVIFLIPKTIVRIEWDRKGLYASYPENHIGRNRGRAYQNHPKAMNHKYGEIPFWDWKDDMWDDFLYTREDEKNGLATNDFKAMRENINFYEVYFENLDTILRVEGSGHEAVRLGLETNASTNSLIINHEWNYEELGWGNYTGKKINVNNPSGNVHATVIRFLSKESK